MSDGLLHGTRRCDGLLLVSSTVDALADAQLEDVLSAGGITESVLDADARRRLGLLRMWCGYTTVLVLRS